VESLVEPGPVGVTGKPAVSLAAVPGRRKATLEMAQRLNDFTNVSEENALLLVIITGQADNDVNDILIAREDSELMRERLGPDVIRKIEATGTQFWRENS
jgi:hypothetical protein